MPEMPTQPESLINDDSQSYEFGGATSSEDFQIRDPSSATGWPGGDSWTRGLLVNLVIPLALLAGAAVVVLLLGTVQPEQRPPADTSRAGRLRALPSVRVAKIESLESTGVDLQLRVDGTVVPYRETQIAAEVAGRIVFKSELCEAGSYVRKDEVLMRIDATDYELEVQRLGRMQEQEYQALQEVDQEMINTQRLIEVAQEDVQLQQKEVDRQKSLPDGFAAPAEVDQALRALLQAKQQLVTSQNQLDLLRKRRVRLEASERLAATQLRQAEINLERTEIKAPIDGVIVNEDAELNSFVARGSTLVTMEDTSKVEVATSLRMDQLYWILDQQRRKVDHWSRGYDLPETKALIEYELSGRDDVVYRWQGRLLSYDGIGLDPDTRTVPVRVLVDNPREFVNELGEVQSTASPTALVRGMFVRVKLLIHPQTPLVVIPPEALKPGNRIWQFIPDESVLEENEGSPATDPKSQQETADSENSEDDKATETEPAPDDSFTPDAWSPGRVVVRRGITPVDSLSIGSETEEPANRFAASDLAKSRKWVCEVRGQAIAEGSLVVISPLGHVGSEGLNARADTTTTTGAGDDEVAGHSVGAAK